MSLPLGRSVRRHLVPRVIVSLVYLVRDRALVSSLARVQLSSTIRFGRGTVVKPFAVITTHSGAIRFGRRCAVSSFDHISTGDSDVIVGEGVRIAPSVTLLGGTRNFHRRDVPIVEQGSTEKGLVIGDDVLIGAGATVLPGCHIGEGAVIGAGSVVDAPVPPYAIVAGVPARIVGERS